MEYIQRNTFKPDAGAKLPEAPYTTHVVALLYATSNQRAIWIRQVTIIEKGVRPTNNELQRLDLLERARMETAETWDDPTVSIRDLVFLGSSITSLITQ